MDTTEYKVLLANAKHAIARHGFLPEEPPKTCFPEYSELCVLDELGHQLPLLLDRSEFRKTIKQLDIPHWSATWDYGDDIAYLRLYYLRLGFIASAYINQVGYEKATELPENIAVPLV